MHLKFPWNDLPRPREAEANYQAGNDWELLDLGIPRIWELQWCSAGSGKRLQVNAPAPPSVPCFSAQSASSSPPPGDLTTSRCTSTLAPSPSRFRSLLFYLRGGGGWKKTPRQPPHSAHPKTGKSSCEVSSVGWVWFDAAVPAHWTFPTCWGAMRLRGERSSQMLQTVVRARRRIEDWRCSVEESPEQSNQSTAQSGGGTWGGGHLSQNGARKVASLASDLAGGKIIETLSFIGRFELMYSLKGPIKHLISIK